MEGDEMYGSYGKEFRILTKQNGEIKNRVKGNEQAMFYWALQYGDCAEILEPASLREKIRSAVEKMAKKYGNS